MVATQAQKTLVAKACSQIVIHSAMDKNPVAKRANLTAHLPFLVRECVRSTRDEPPPLRLLPIEP